MTGATLTYMGTIGHRIEAFMLRHGLSQRELARRAGFKSETQCGNTIRKLKERPKKVQVDTLERLAHGMGVSVYWLWTGRGSPDDSEPPEADYSKPKFKDLPNWNDIRKRAELLVPHPSWVWDDVAETSPVAVTDAAGDVTVAEVIDMAEHVLKYSKPPSSAPMRSLPKKASQ